MIGSYERLLIAAPALLLAIREHGIGGIFSPNPVVWNHLAAVLGPMHVHDAQVHDAEGHEADARVTGAVAHVHWHGVLARHRHDVDDGAVEQQLLGTDHIVLLQPVAETVGQGFQRREGLGIGLFGR